MQRALIALVLSGGFIRATSAPVAPIPESEQAVLALPLIDAYHPPRPADPPKKLRVVYFTPADREPAA